MDDNGRSATFLPNAKKKSHFTIPLGDNTAWAKLLRKPQGPLRLSTSLDPQTES
jgi:hypothetical protein